MMLLANTPQTVEFVSVTFVSLLKMFQHGSTPHPASLLFIKPRVMLIPLSHMGAAGIGVSL